MNKMASANVKLSTAELLLVCDEQFILTKNSIINKVYMLFGEVSERFLSKTKNLKHIIPAEALKLSPKIYRGENYRSLPYVTLDYPRYFSKTNTFAIRCFFWWGNFFSITLHLTGEHAKKFIASSTGALQKSNWYVCVNEDQWEHHFNSDNYALANDEMIAQLKKKLPEETPFLKIAKRIPLQQWDEACDFFISNFDEIFDLLS
jgi:hypothetical protein